MFSSLEIIDIAIQIEQNAVRIYRDALKRTADGSLAVFLSWMVDEEERHLAWFQELRKTVKPTPGDAAIAEMGRAVLHDIVGRQSFSLADADFSKLAFVRDLMVVTAEFESDKVRFFEMLRAFVDDTGTLADLDAIIAEERRHVEQLRHFIETDLKVTF